MALKYMVAILMAGLTGLALLGLRQRRIQTMHDMAALHFQMDRTRQQLWLWQVKIADSLDPPALLAAAKRTHLQLEPVTPLPASGKAGAEQTDARE